MLWQDSMIAQMASSVSGAQGQAQALSTIKSRQRETLRELKKLICHCTDLVDVFSMKVNDDVDKITQSV
jgi:hypothetical protein